MTGGKPAPDLFPIGMIEAQLRACVTWPGAPASLVSAAREAQAVSASQVTVAALDDAAIAAYLATNEWQGKAGAYAIQGRFESHIQHLSGSFSGVMGLPMFETARLLREFGIAA